MAAWPPRLSKMLFLLVLFQRKICLLASGQWPPHICLYTRFVMVTCQFKMWDIWYMYWYDGDLQRFRPVFLRMQNLCTPTASSCVQAEAKSCPPDVARGESDMISPCGGRNQPMWWMDGTIADFLRTQTQPLMWPCLCPRN